MFLSQKPSSALTGLDRILGWFYPRHGLVHHPILPKR